MSLLTTFEVSCIFLCNWGSIENRLNPTIKLSDQVMLVSILDTRGNHLSVKFDLLALELTVLVSPPNYESHKSGKKLFQEKKKEGNKREFAKKTIC